MCTMLIQIWQITCNQSINSRILKPNSIEHTTVGFHEKITVHEAVKGEDGSRELEVEIYYLFIGKID